MYYTLQGANNKGADQTVLMPGWSWPLLFKCNHVRFSRNEAQLSPA